MDVAVDTNVAVVANNRDGSYPDGCPLACVSRLVSIMKSDRVLVDLSGEVIAEYRRLLNSSGQPGIGDAFYMHVLRHFGDDLRTLVVELERRDDGSYNDFPDDEKLEEFDQDDRKYAALARHCGGIVVNAVDSDWLDFKSALGAFGIVVEFVCGAAAARKGTARAKR